MRNAYLLMIMATEMFEMKLAYLRSFTNICINHSCKVSVGRNCRGVVSVFSAVTFEFPHEGYDLNIQALDVAQVEEFILLVQHSCESILVGHNDGSSCI